MAELYRPELRYKPRGAVPDDLPGIGSLDATQVIDLGVHQVQAALEKLKGAITDSGLPLDPVQAAVAQVQAAADAASQTEKIRDLHIELLCTLTAADFRLGKAYGLGRALADTCRNPQTVDDLRQELKPSRVARLGAWIGDLSSNFLPHAGHAVRDSLNRWGQAMATEARANDVDARHILPQFRRQGALWRSLLSGEKLATDMLELSNYITATEGLIMHFRNMGRQLISRFRLLTILIAVLFFGGIALAVFAGTNASIVAGAAAIFASLGLTWKSVGSSMGRALANVEQPAWEAQLDLAIADVITKLPDHWLPGPQASAGVGRGMFRWLSGGGSATSFGPMPPPSAAPEPPPITHATDARRVRKTAREVWKRLDRASRARASQGFSPGRRLSYRYGGRLRTGPRLYMPRDPYLSQVQAALETRLEMKRAGPIGEGVASSPAGGDAADGSTASAPGSASAPAAAPAASQIKTRELGDQLFGQFGPDDWGWITTVVHDALTLLEGKHAFGQTPTEHEMPQRVRLFLFGDWATGTARAQGIAAEIARRLVPGDGVENHVIHLGDVYYCGLADEYQSRFLRYWPASPDQTNTFSWNLNGNHDMYSGGSGYFGVISGQSQSAGADKGGLRFEQQGTSFFRLYNQDWQIVALDTAYTDNDLEPRQIPSLNRWLGVGDTTPDGPPPAQKTILLSHHQLGSARSQSSVGAGIRKKTEAARNTGRIHAWFWGHEHRCFMYQPYLGVNCPVCIGNGGVPELLSQQLTLAGLFQSIFGFLASLFRRAGITTRAPEVKWEPGEPDVDVNGLKWEKLGFVVIDLDGAAGTAVYVDEDGIEQAVERFRR